MVHVFHHCSAVLFFAFGLNLGASATHPVPSKALRRAATTTTTTSNNKNNNINGDNIKSHASSRHLQTTGCATAVALGLNATIEGEFPSVEGSWYVVTGTGETMAASTCTGDSILDSVGVDTIISVYYGNCDGLSLIAQDDDGGHCMNLKSTATFHTEPGATYYVNVAPYGGYYDPNYSDFGVILLDADEIPTPPDYYYNSCEEDGECCETAVPFGVGDSPMPTMPSGMFWFSVDGTGGYIMVRICTEDDTPGEVSGDVYSGDCMNYVDSIYGFGSSCTTYYLNSAAGELYHFGVYGYGYTGAGHVITISETTELPSTICGGATTLELDQVVEGETFLSGESLWYSFVGTGQDVAISTCVGNELDGGAFDSVIQVYARDCSDLRSISSDDEGGKCGNGKSTVILSSVEGLMYKIAVSEYRGELGRFGLVVSAI